MGCSIIPSGSLDESEIKIPSWAKPTTVLEIKVGKLAKVLQSNDHDWKNELVLILQEDKRLSNKLEKTCTVVGKKGIYSLPIKDLLIQE